MYGVLNQARREEIKDKYLRGGVTYKSLSEEYGVSVSTIQQVLLSFGVSSNTKSVPVDTKQQVVMDYTSNRYTVEQIANKYGISVPSVYSWVSKHRNGESLSSSTRGKLTQKDVSSIVHDYTVCRMGTRRLAEKYGVTSNAIMYILKSSGVYEGKSGGAERKLKVNEYAKNNILADYNCGFSMTELTSKYNVTNTTIRTVLQEFGITCPYGRGRGKHSSSRTRQISQEVIAYHKTGLFSHKNLADRYGVSTRTISRILDDAGLEAVGSVQRTPADVMARVRGDVLSDLASGMDRFDVAVKHGIPLDTVDRISGGESTGKEDVVSDKVVALMEGGMKMSEIAGELGVSVYIVRKVLVERGIDTRMVKAGSTSKGTKADRCRSQILELHALGKKPPAIAEELGLSCPTVRSVLKGAGVERVKKQVEKKGSKSDRMRDDILRLHQEGKNAVKIAQELGVSAPTVRKVLSSAESHVATSVETHVEPVVEPMTVAPSKFIVDMITNVWKRRGDVGAVAAETGMDVEMVKAILKKEVGV